MWGKVFLLGLLCVFAVPAWATNFAVLLGGTGDSGNGTTTDVSKNIREIAIDELNIDVREMTTGLDVEYRRAQKEGWRIYGPGQAHWGNATISVVAGADTELYTWYTECAKGKNIRKNITVTVKARDGKPVRTFNLVDCFPMSWDPGEPDPTGIVATETLKVSIGRIEFKTRAAPPNTGGPVVVSGPNGAPIDSFDSWHGGEPNMILSGLFSGDKFHTFSPGHKSVGEITLRGAMRDGRGPLCEWINDTVNGKPWKQMLTITEMLSTDGTVKAGKKYNYLDCFPTRYVFPKISVDGADAEQLMEEVTVKPIRVELK